MIAIHTSSGAFAPGWVEYCRNNGLPFKEVDCFSSDIIQQLQGCRALLWHWAHNDYKAALFARQLIASVEAMGILVFPDVPTCWHYDDKIGQKYLLEAVGAPLVPSYVFYERERALAWLETAKFPLVWKLRGGAGSQNVRLVRSAAEARRIIARSFGRGWQADRFHALRERLWHFRREPGLRSFVNIGRGVARAIIPHEKQRNLSVERNYVYFQEFVPDNDHDIRIIVIGARAFAIKRMTRDGDFRASGSGMIVYDKNAIPEECVRIAFEVTSRIRSQSCAFDFVCSGTEWKFVEISYAFSLPAYLECPGYWTPDLAWHAKPVRPDYFMIEDILARLNPEQRQSA